MNVFLLGAGASKSYDQSPTGIKMPVARDFFQTFDKLKISENPWVLIDAIIGYLEITKKIYNHTELFSYLRSGINIENLHSEVEKYRNDALRNNDINWMIHFKAYNQMVFLFSSVINEIQNGPLSKPHLNIASVLSPNDVIITFNWDTLMDRALQKKTKWNVDFGYGVKAHKIFRNAWIDPVNIEYTAPKLIKLHGSTNWLTSHISTDGYGHLENSHIGNPGILHIYEHSTIPYPCYQGRFMKGYKPFSYGYYPPNLLDIKGKEAENDHVFIRININHPWKKKGTAPQNGLDSMPLIIPPVKEKQYSFFGSLFIDLWQKAEDNLVKAEKIIIIGYSFPYTDNLSNKLFKKAFLKRKDYPKIFIIDPAPEKIANKFEQDFGIIKDNIKIFKCCFSEKFDIASITNSQV